MKTTVGELSEFLVDSNRQIQMEHGWWDATLNHELTLWQMEKNIPQVVDLSNQIRQKMDANDPEALFEQIGEVEGEISAAAMNCSRTKEECQQISDGLDAILDELKELNDETIPTFDQNAYELGLILSPIQKRIDEMKEQQQQQQEDQP